MRTDIPRKDGTCELSLQAFVNTKRKLVGLDVFFFPEEFDKDEQRVVYIKGKSIENKRKADDYNLLLQKKLAKASDIFMHHRLIDKSLTAAEFEKLFKETAARFDFYTFVDKEIQKLKLERNKSTLFSYKNTLALMKLFRKKLEFGELTFSLITDFDRFMRGYTKENKKKEKLKIHVNTIWKHHRNIKFFINQAIKKGNPIENPYKVFKAKSVHVEPPFLTQEHVKKLLDLYDHGTTRGPHQRSLRLFLFACFTGLRISDVFGITSEMIVENTLIFPMKKGRHLGKICRVPLNETAKKFILNNYGHLFDKVSEKQVNLDLKEIARLADINFKLSFHIGRHTFAVQFLLAGGRVQELQKILGHSNINTTMIYVHITDGMKSDAIRKMDDRFLSESKHSLKSQA